MKYYTCVHAFCALLLLFSVTASVKADPTPASPVEITGTVVTPDGKHVPDATVTMNLYDFHTNQVLTSLTTKPDQNGVFKLTLPAQVPELYRYIVPELYVTSAQGTEVSPVTNDLPTVITIGPFTQVRIHLMDGDGNPVPNLKIVPVRMFNKSGLVPLSKSLTPQWVGVTDAQGNAVLAGLPQYVQLGIDLDDTHYAPLGKDTVFALAASATTPDQTYHVSLASSISGTVTYGASGSPASGVRLTANSVSTGRPYEETTTDNNGNYTFNRLLPGTYYISISNSDANTLANWTAAMAPAHVPPATDIVGIDINLIRGALLAGTVRDKTTGKAARGIIVEVGDVIPGTGWTIPDQIVQTGPNGRFRFRVAPGEQNLMATENNGYFSIVGYNTISQEINVEGSMRYVDLYLDYADPLNPVRGLVVGPNGAPVAGAKVTAIVPMDTAAITDSNGRFVFKQPGIPAGAELTAQSGSLFTLEPVIASASGDTVLRLSQGASATFHGQIKSDDGAPIVNASATLNCQHPGNGPPSIALTTTTDSSGYYSFPPVYSGFLYSVGATAPGYDTEYSNFSDGMPGSSAFQLITLSKMDSFAGGTVVDPKGNPESGAIVQCSCSPNLQATTDAKGRFLITGVPRKACTLCVQASDNRSATVQVSSGRKDNVIEVENAQEAPAVNPGFAALEASDLTFHGDGADANLLLKNAESRALAFNKYVMLVFGASWCLPCYRLHLLLNDVKFRAVIEPHFVVQDLDVSEAASKHWENPGADALYDRYAAFGQGVPFVVVLDGHGNEIGMLSGMPDSSATSLLSLMNSLCPSLTSADIATMKDAVNRINNRTLAASS